MCLVALSLAMWLRHSLATRTARIVQERPWTFCCAQKLNGKRKPLRIKLSALAKSIMEDLGLFISMGEIVACTTGSSGSQGLHVRVCIMRRLMQGKAPTNLTDALVHTPRSIRTSGFCGSDSTCCDHFFPWGIVRQAENSTSHFKRVSRLRELSFRTVGLKVYSMIIYRVHRSVEYIRPKGCGGGMLATALVFLFLLQRLVCICISEEFVGGSVMKRISLSYCKLD